MEWLQFADTIDQLDSDSKADSLSEVMSEVKNATFLASDVNHRLPSRIRDMGFNTMKSVIPEFQPLYLTESLRDIAWERISFVERNLDINSPFPKGFINEFPHPFL